MGNESSLPADMSSDGRFVLFGSDASDLVGGDTNGESDVFVREMTLGTTTRVSVTPAGIQSSGSSAEGDITAHGRHVLFGSSSTDIVAGDVNGHVDQFVFDRDTSTTTLASVAIDGTQGNANAVAA